MNWLYPKVRNFKAMAPFLFFGIILSGIYGLLHDQISYTLSQEYFTHLKFIQFDYADFGLPDRVFVGIIGFLATFWVGMIVAWILGRIRFNSERLDRAGSDMFKGFGIVFLTAIVAGILGFLAGYIRVHYFPVNDFLGWEQELEPAALNNFVWVSYLHYASYSGGFVGLILAVIFIKGRMGKNKEPGNEIKS